MDLYKKVEEKLNELNIPFEIVEHEPALTTEQADSLFEKMILPPGVARHSGC